MDSMIIPLTLLAIVGGYLSHVLAKRKLRREQQRYFRIHAAAMTAMADAAVEILAVDCGMDIRTAQQRLQEEAKRRLPSIIGFLVEPSAEAFRQAQAYVDKKRAEIAAAKEAGNGKKPL